MLKNSTMLATKKAIAHKTFVRFLCASMVAIAMLFATEVAYGQCEDAVPCVSNINDYQCIVTGSVAALMGNKLLFYPGPAEITAQKIIVKTTLQIDVAYRFAAGREIIMLPGSKILVGSDFGTLGHVTIKGCGGSWEGIRVFSNGTLTLVNSDISDACAAVDLMSGSKAQITGNTFKSNYFCIRAGGTITLLGEGIAHNMFKLPITSGCTGVNPHAIKLTNVPSITIGDIAQGGQPNTIQNYFTGIHAYNSNIDVYNTTVSFYSTSTAPAIRLLGEGGVYHATINGLGNMQNSSMLVNSYPKGIQANNCHSFRYYPWQQIL